MNTHVSLGGYCPRAIFLGSQRFFFFPSWGRGFSRLIVWTRSVEHESALWLARLRDCQTTETFDFDRFESNPPGRREGAQHERVLKEISADKSDMRIVDRYGSKERW